MLRHTALPRQCRGIAINNGLTVQSYLKIPRKALKYPENVKISRKALKYPEDE